MATLMPEGKQSFTDGAGAPLVGGKLYTYDAGTNTPRPTFSDAAGTVPNTNPVILDARGEAAIFWSGAYKMVLKTAADVTIWTVDQSIDPGSITPSLDGTELIPLIQGGSNKNTLIGTLSDWVIKTYNGFIQAGSGAVARTLQSKARETVSVKDFGAVGDGVADDTAALNSAYAYAATRGCRVIHPAGRYRHSGIDINMLSSISLEGEAQPHIGPGGTQASALIYTGSGNGLTVRNTSGTGYSYRFDMKRIGMWASGNSPTVNAMVYIKNMQEAMFYDVGINSTAGVTIAKGYDIDSAGITYWDYCVVANVGIGFDFRFAAGSMSSGGINITRCNVFNVTTGISLGLTYQLNISGNWFEAFKTAILVENGNSKLRSEVFGLNIKDNVFLQSIATNTDARVLRVSCPSNTNPIRVKLNISGNWCHNSSGTAMPYAVSFDTAACVSFVKVGATIEDNWFYGVSVSGIYSDSVKPSINYSNNETLDSIDGNYLPQFTGVRCSGPVPRNNAGNYTSVNSSATTAEEVLASFTLPAYPGLNASFDIHAFFSMVNNGNTKIVRVRIGDAAGPIINQVDASGNGQVILNTRLSLRNSHLLQLAHGDYIKSGGSSGTWLNSSSLDFRNQVTVYITSQKGSSVDSIVLEAYRSTYNPS